MAHHTSVFNVTRGYAVKLRQALKGIEQCSVTWVEEGVSIRNLTLAESIVMRNEQAKMREPLPYYEIPGILYEPAKRNERQHFAGMEQVWQAHDFARQAA